MGGGWGKAPVILLHLLPYLLKKQSCIIIPCHRVIGADGSLTGYGGGLGNKVSLLAREGVDVVGGLCVRSGRQQD